jgi:hypothetical protein
MSYLYAHTFVLLCSNDILFVQAMAQIGRNVVSGRRDKHMPFVARQNDLPHAAAEYEKRRVILLVKQIRT